MTHGEMPLGWGWMAPNRTGGAKYFVVKYKQCSYFYTSLSKGRVNQHDVSKNDSIPTDKRLYPHFFLPVGVI